MNNNFKNITGVIPAMITTFDEKGNLDLNRAKNLVEALIKKGISGLYLTGSTGEGFLMTMEERKTYAKAIIDFVDSRIPVIVHIGAIGTDKSIELAKHAKKIGASAISSVPPFYYNFSDKDIYTYYKDISDAVDIPMIVYNISLAGLMNKNLVLSLAQIENVKGLKFTGREHDDMAHLKHKLGQDFMIYSGCDEMAVQGVLAGADGLIGSTYNLMAETFVKIFKLAKEDKYKEAFKIQESATALIFELCNFEFFAALKCAITFSGIDVGFVRKPFINLTESEGKKLIENCKKLKKEYDVSSIDFLNYL